MEPATWRVRTHPSIDNVFISPTFAPSGLSLAHVMPFSVLVKASGDYSFALGHNRVFELTKMTQCRKIVLRIEYLAYPDLMGLGSSNPPYSTGHCKMYSRSDTGLPEQLDNVIHSCPLDILC